jgi:hypothetical protein
METINVWPKTTYKDIANLIDMHVRNSLEQKLEWSIRLQLLEIRRPMTLEIKLGDEE